MNSEHNLPDGSQVLHPEALNRTCPVQNSAGWYRAKRQDKGVSASANPLYELRTEAEAGKYEKRKNPCISNFEAL